MVVDRLVADRSIHDPTLSGSDRDCAARVSDALRSWPREGAEHRFVPLSCARWDWCTNTYTLPWLSHEVANLSFTQDIANVKDPITALLSKVLNSRCQTRKYGTVAEKALFESPDDLAEFQRVRSIDDALRTPDESRFYANYHDIIKRRAGFKQIVLCSLLGNYPHVEAAHRHMTGETRARLYVLMETGDQWFQSLLHGASMLVVWCVREFLVHALQDQPGLLSAVRSFMHFDQFSSLTAHAMSAVRLYIQQNLMHGWSSMGGAVSSSGDALCRCMHKRLNQRKGSVRIPKPMCLFREREWLRDVETLLQSYHDSMLLIAYRKPDAGTLSFLMGKEVRTAAPLVERQLSDAERKEMNTELARARELSRAEAEEDQMRESLQRSMGKIPYHQRNEANTRFKMIAGDERDAREESRKQVHQDACAVAFVFTFIAPAQFHALSRLIDLAGPRTELSDVVPFFCPHFGIPEQDIDVVDFILTLINHHRNGTVSKHERMRQLVLLREREPHAYNLMQVAAELIKAHQRKRASVVGYLSRETVDAQIAALRNKTRESLTLDDQARLLNADKCIAKAGAKVRKDANAWSDLLAELHQCRAVIADRMQQTLAAFDANPVIEESSAHLYACSVCSTVYSNVRDAHSSQRMYYRWGLRSAEFNYIAGTLHCYNNKVSHLGHCATTPLHRVNLIGVRYALEKRAFQLCVKCGDIFHPTASTGECTEWQGLGLMCCDCTAAHRAKSSQGDNDPADVWLRALVRKCVCCEATTRTLKHTYLYPFDLVVCYRCHTKRLLAFVRGQQSKMYDYEGAQAMIRTFWVKSRLRRRHALVRKGAPAMKRNRQRNRQRKC